MDLSVMSGYHPSAATPEPVRDHTKKEGGERDAVLHPIPAKTFRRIVLCQAAKTRQTFFASISKNDLARHVGGALSRAAVRVIHPIPIGVAAVVSYLVILGRIVG